MKRLGHMLQLSNKLHPLNVSNVLDIDYWCIYGVHKSSFNINLNPPWISLPSSLVDLLLRTGLHQGPWSWTMEDGLFPCSDFIVQLPWSDFLENQFTKFLGSSLGVNQMWINKNDHPPQKGCAIFLDICPKR